MSLKKAFFLTLTMMSSISNAQKVHNPAQYVHPIIGTEKMGHTYPGATVPFGAVQLSPETDTLSYEINGNIIPTSTSTAPAIATKTKPL